MSEIIAGVRIPDSAPARDATTLIRDTTNELIYHHSRRVYLFGSLQARRFRRCHQQLRVVAVTGSRAQPGVSLRLRLNTPRHCGLIEPTTEEPSP
jgi:hypothetical protein